MHKNSVSFTILLSPVSWKAHGGYGRHSYNPRSKERKAFQREIRKLFLFRKAFEKGVSIKICYHCKAPKSLKNRSIHHLKRPDLDNLNKFFIDCLKGIVIKDDSQVFEVKAKKVYAQEEPFVFCSIEFF